MSDRFFWTRPSRVIGSDPRIALVPIRELMTWLRNRPAPQPEPAPEPLPAFDLPPALSRTAEIQPEMPEPTQRPMPVLPSAFDPRRAPAPRISAPPPPAPVKAPAPTLPPQTPPPAPEPPQPGLWQLTNRFTLPERRSTLRRPNFTVAPNVPPLAPVLPPAPPPMARQVPPRQPLTAPPKIETRLPPATQAPEPVPVVLPPVQAPTAPPAPAAPPPMPAPPPQIIQRPAPVVLPPVPVPQPPATPQPIAAPVPQTMQAPRASVPPTPQPPPPMPVVLPPVQAPAPPPPPPRPAPPQPIAAPIPQSMRVPTPMVLPPVQAPVAVPMPAQPPRPAPTPAPAPTPVPAIVQPPVEAVSPPEPKPVSAAGSARPSPIPPPELLQAPSHPIQPPRVQAPPPPPPPPEQALPSGPIDISQPAVFAPLPEGSGPKEPARRIVPPPEYDDDLLQEYDDLFEPQPDPAHEIHMADDAPADHESMIATDWSRLRRVTNGELADEEWMGGPVPTASRPAPQRSDWQRVAMFAGGVLAILAAGAGMVVLLWPQPAPAQLAGVVTGSAISVFAPAEGRLSRVLVTPGTRVSRGAPLFEISGRGPDPAVRSDLTARLAVAHAHADRLADRLRELDALLATNKAAPSNAAAQRDAELMRQRQRDLRDEQRDTETETAQLERSLAALSEPAAIRTVAAEQEAVIRRLLVAQGQDVVPGLALGELVNCDTLFITADGTGAAAQGLVSGRALHIRVDGSPTPIEAQVPGVALRKGAAAADDRSAALAVSGQLLVPIDKAAVERAAGQSCPIGRHAVIEAD